MEIEELGRQAIDIIKSKWELPTKGLLAGGSIANIIWELASGNKSVINDLDIFIKTGDLELPKKDNTQKDKKNIKRKERYTKPIFEKKEFKREYFEDYHGLTFRDEIKGSYRITEAKQDGIYNTIEYKSTSDDYSIVINSFDINCTQVGYIIEEDKLIWAKDFENFIKSGVLKITNLITPAHTAIRIVKKAKELRCNLDYDFELKLTQHAIKQGFQDTVRLRFKDKYFKIFQDNLDILSKYFTIQHDEDCEQYIKTFYKLESVYHLTSVKISPFKKNHSNDIANISHTSTFLFYMRNIYGSEKLSYIWQKLKWFFDSLDYIDNITTSKEDIELLGRLTKYAPNTIEKLRGYKLSQQVTLFKRLLSEFKGDPLLAISILEKHEIDIDFEFTEEDKLLLELSVRKEIIDDERNKVGRILIEEIEEIEDELEIGDVFDFLI